MGVERRQREGGLGEGEHLQVAKRKKEKPNSLVEGDVHLKK